MLAACTAVALAGCGAGEHAIDPQVKAASFTFDPRSSPQDQEWILAAVAKVRPEARQLIDDVDGMVTISTYSEPDGGAVGTAQQVGEHQFQVRFNLAYLDGERKADRDTTVVHELGHVIDFALMPEGMREQLAGQLPSSGACFTADTGDCTAPEERFADTFAKWALRGAVSAAGAGYGTLSPGSLESWGAPLADAGDRRRRRLPVDRPLVARRAVAAQLDERERRAAPGAVEPDDLEARRGHRAQQLLLGRAAQPFGVVVGDDQHPLGHRRPHHLEQAVDQVRREVDDHASRPGAARPAARAAAA